VITSGGKNKEVEEFENEDGIERGIFTYFVEQVLEEEKKNLLSPQQIIEKVKIKMENSEELKEQKKEKHDPSFSSLIGLKQPDLIATPFISIYKPNYLIETTKKEIKQSKEIFEKKKKEFQEKDILIPKIEKIKNENVLIDKIKEKCREFYNSLKSICLNEEKDIDLCESFVDISIKKYQDFNEKKENFLIQSQNEKLKLNSFWYRQYEKNKKEEKGENIKIEEIIKKCDEKILQKKQNFNNNNNNNSLKDERIILIEGKAGIGKKKNNKK
jgi:hypothetical protein